ncbi:MAG: hypothetical protein HN337_08755 [Deltaproteobacteria bacterium]|jgi:hypothetical protein|nr:hypothetical protein [Deltaproteobacteria bacterium]
MVDKLIESCAWIGLDDNDIYYPERMELAKVVACDDPNYPCCKLIQDYQRYDRIAQMCMEDRVSEEQTPDRNLASLISGRKRRVRSVAPTVTAPGDIDGQAKRIVALMDEFEAASPGSRRKRKLFRKIGRATTQIMEDMEQRNPVELAGYGIVKKREPNLDDFSETSDKNKRRTEFLQLRGWTLTVSTKVKGDGIKKYRLLGISNLQDEQLEAMVIPLDNDGVVSSDGNKRMSERRAPHLFYNGAMLCRSSEGRPESSNAWKNCSDSQSINVIHSKIAPVVPLPLGTASN